APVTKVEVPDAVIELPPEQNTETNITTNLKGVSEVSDADPQMSSMPNIATVCDQGSSNVKAVNSLLEETRGHRIKVNSAQMKYNVQMIIVQIDDFDTSTEWKTLTLTANYIIAGKIHFIFCNAITFEKMSHFDN
ncbi:Protein of unknown function, partial [Gryllus bimaculatus]